MRSNGSIRIHDGVIAAMGALQPEPGERRLDASGCVIYPGLISTHHHMFQSVLKGVQSGINLPLRKHVYRRRGAMASERARSPVSPLDAGTKQELDRILRHLGLADDLGPIEEGATATPPTGGVTS